MSIRKATYEGFVRSLDASISRGEIDPSKRDQIIGIYNDEFDANIFEIRRSIRNRRVTEFAKKMSVLVKSGRMTKQDAIARIDEFIKDVIMPESHEDNLEKEQEEREELRRMLMAGTIYTLRFLFVLVPRFVLVTVPVSVIRFARSSFVKIELATRPEPASRARIGSVSVCKS